MLQHKRAAHLLKIRSALQRAAATRGKVCSSSPFFDLPVGPCFSFGGSKPPPAIHQDGHPWVVHTEACMLHTVLPLTCAQGRRFVASLNLSPCIFVCFCVLVDPLAVRGLRTPCPCRTRWRSSTPCPLSSCRNRTTTTSECEL